MARRVATICNNSSMRALTSLKLRTALTTKSIHIIFKDDRTVNKHGLHCIISGDTMIKLFFIAGMVQPVYHGK